MTKLQHLKSWEAHYRKVEAATQALRDLVGIEYGSQLYEALWDMQSYVAALSEILGDDENYWLDWYMVENDMGRLGLQAGNEAIGTRAIRTLEDLVWLIEGVRK
jgi:hypothetical protein